VPRQLHELVLSGTEFDDGMHANRVNAFSDGVSSVNERLIRVRKLYIDYGRTTALPDSIADINQVFFSF